MIYLYNLLILRLTKDKKCTFPKNGEKWQRIATTNLRVTLKQD